MIHYVLLDMPNDMLMDILYASLHFPILQEGLFSRFGLVDKDGKIRVHTKNINKLKGNNEK